MPAAADRRRRANVWLFAGASALFAVTACWMWQDAAVSRRTTAGVTVSSKPVNLQWRLTRDGWRQIDIGPQPPFQLLNLPRPVPRVHPFLFTASLLLLVVAASVWASDEWEWERLTDSRRNAHAGAVKE